MNEFNNSAVMNPLKEEESLKNNSIICDNTLQFATETMKSRNRYSYSFMDIVYNYLNLFNVLGLCCRNSLKSLNQRHKLYLKGEDKFLEEFDAVSFARTQRKLKMLLNWLMDKSERFLAVYQKTNAICLSSDSESSSSRHDLYKEVPKLRSNATHLQKHNTNIDKFFEEYLKEKHTEKKRYKIASWSLFK